MSARARKPTGGKSNFSARSWNGDSRKGSAATQIAENKTIDRLVQQEVERNNKSLAMSGLFEQDIISAREALKRSAGNLRVWVQQERDAEAVPIPPKVGSILSGGVDGFGYLRKETKVDPERFGESAGAPVYDKNYKLMSPGRPWWERERFQEPHLAKSARDEVEPSSPVSCLSTPPTLFLASYFFWVVEHGLCFFSLTDITHITRHHSLTTCQLPYGSALNVAAIQNDGKLTATEEFIGRRPVSERKHRSFHHLSPRPPPPRICLCLA
jgi:hypothetical protein